MHRTIHRLKVGVLEVDEGEFVQYRNLGNKIQAPVYAYLIEGGEGEPVLVDTGAGDVAMIKAELNRFGLVPADSRCSRPTL